jgi:hypothetical protein
MEANAWYQLQWWDDRSNGWSHFLSMDVTDPHFDKKFELYWESMDRSYPSAKKRILLHTTEEVDYETLKYRSS